MNYGKDMNDPEHGNPGNGEMDDIGRLIRHGGAREPVPSERLARSRDKVRNHWEQVLREQQAGPKRRPILFLAKAASVVAVLGIALVLASRWPASTPDVAVASIQRIVGELSLDGEPVTAGADIPAGALLTTGPSGRAALQLVNGQSLRIDTDTALVMDTADRLHLDEGAVYIDTWGAEDADPVQVVTPLGTASDIGTQFQVRLIKDALLVGVRDGLVEFQLLGNKLLQVNAGFQLRFDAAGDARQEALDAQDPDWRWIESVTPVFDIDGASLADYLAWYANEEGLDLVWADDKSQAQAEKTTLTGSIEGVSTADSLVLVQRVAPFEYRAEAGELWVKLD